LNASMGTLLKIREATESDLPAIVDIYNASLGSRLATTNTQPATVTRSLGWFRQHKATSKPILVAEENNKVIGWLSFRPFYRRPAYDAAAKLLIYVAPNNRSKGVGSVLLKKALEQSPSIGLSAVVGYILSENKPARRLLERQGFEQWGYFPKVAELDGVKRDLVVMGHKI
jgi:L-amino acid N-acyltransferase YncA